MNKKEQLLKKIEETKKEFTDRLNELQKELEDVNKRTYWIPAETELYWFLQSSGKVAYTGNSMSSDKKNINNLNCYKTEELAERQAFEELLYRKLKKFAIENNEGEIDWNASNIPKYCIYYNHINQYLNTNVTCSYEGLGQVYFTSEEIAKRAIEEFKEELLRYYQIEVSEVGVKCANVTNDTNEGRANFKWV